MAQKLKSEALAERIKRLQADQRRALDEEDKAADALLLSLARRAHMRDRFLQEAREALAARRTQRTPEQSS